MKFSEKYLLDSYDDIYNAVKEEITNHHKAIIKNQLNRIEYEKEQRDNSKIKLREEYIERCMKSLDNIDETLIGVIGNRGYYLYTLVERMNALFPNRDYNDNNYDEFEVLCNQIKSTVDGFGIHSSTLYNEIIQTPHYKSNEALKKFGYLFNLELLSPNEIEIAISKLGNSAADNKKKAELYLKAGYLTPDDILMETKEEYANYIKNEPKMGLYKFY